MSTKEQKVKVDADYSLMPVPRHARRNIVTMFMIMLGFTFFSASMWTGQELGIGLDLKGFVEALLLGGAILGIYTALLAYVGCKTGLSMDLLAQHSFGKKGSYLPSALISFTQIGWFGVAMFAIPVAKLIAPDKPWVVPLLVALAGICMTGSAFFGIRAMMIVSYISVPLIAMLGITAMIMAVRQGDASLAEKFAESQGLGVITGAGMVIGSFVSGGTATPNFARFAKTPKAAVWTTNDNALYSAGLGLSNITKIKKSPLVLISGALGTVAAIWLYNNFTGWLNILNCTLPPVGAILILGYFCHKEDYDQDKEDTLEVNWFAIAGVILGAVVANVVPVEIASINGMAVAVVCYLVGFAAGRKK